MTLTVENLEYLLLIIVRLSAFIFSAPIFSVNYIPVKVKILMSVFLGVLVYYMVPVNMPQSAGMISFAIVILQESIAGLMLGFISNACLYIVNFSGRIIDMEIGFAMANVIDPSTKMQASVTGAYYTQFVSILLLVSNMHYYIIKAIIDSFKYIPVGEVFIHRNMYEIVQTFIVDYFIIGFRIVLPVFAITLIVNVVLGVLAKIAPQMNMFVVGMQLKVFVGLFSLLIIAGMIPMIANYIFEEMREYIGIVMNMLSKGT